MDLGRALKEIRVRAGYVRQSQAAVALDANPAYLSELETNRKFPGKQMLEKMSLVYSTPIPIIFYRALSEEDVQPGKQAAYSSMKPLMDKWVEEVFMK